MEWLYVIYVLMLLVAAVVSGLLALSAARFWSVTGTRFAVPLLAGVSFWAFCTWLSTLIGDERLVTLFMLKLRFLAISVVPVFFLCFALEYTGHEAWLRRRRLLPLFLVPAITQAINWSPASRLFVRDVRFVAFGPFHFWGDIEWGAWFWVHTWYSYALIVVSLTLLVSQTLNTYGLYRRQAVIVLAGASLVFAGNVFSTFLMSGSPRLDWTVVSLSATSIVWYWAIYRYRLLDVVPVARDAILERIEEPVIALEPGGRIVDLNPAACALLGGERASLTGTPIEIALPGPSAAVSFECGATERHAELRIDVRGELRILDMTLSPLRRGGTNVGCLLLLRDVTERVRLIEELDAYARAVAHDLKDPLAAVLGYLEMAREERAGRLDDELVGWLRGAEQSARNMIRIIDSLFLLATVRKLDDVTLESLDMNAIIGEVRIRLASQIAETGARVSVPPEWPHARGYAPWVEEVWANYLSNALKYGGVPPEIELGGERNGSFVRFWVRDNGRGLVTQDQSRLFSEFTRLDGGRAQGHGLGLSIVRRIVERLGGTVGVESAPGRGSTFWFTLPAGD